MKNKWWIFLLLLFLNTTSCDKNSGGGTPAPQPPPVPTNTFTNPILTSGPDPWIIQKDNVYYYTHTLGNRIAIWKTSKVSELRNAPVTVVWTAPASGPDSKNVWAPELHFLDGKWYLYYTAGSSNDFATQRIFVLENSNADPTSGTWISKGEINDPAANVFSIDGSVLEHGGKKYLLWSSQTSDADKTQRIYIAEMANPWTLATSRQLISSPQFPWETMGAPPAVNEGPQVLKNASGKLFIIYSASGCWTDDYALGMLTLKDGGNVLNASDWMKSSSPVFSKNPSSSVFGPGHNSFFKSADGTEDWILYHANSQPGQGCGDSRNPRIQKFTWNADGTPNFGQPVKTGTNIIKPSGE
jgi:GH43 family beta-xylosidase